MSSDVQSELPSGHEALRENRFSLRPTALASMARIIHISVMKVRVDCGKQAER